MYEFSYSVQTSILCSITILLKVLETENDKPSYKYLRLAEKIVTQIIENLCSFSICLHTQREDRKNSVVQSFSNLLLTCSENTISFSSPQIKKRVALCIISSQNHWYTLFVYLMFNFTGQNRKSMQLIFQFNHCNSRSSQ